MLSKKELDAQLEKIKDKGLDLRLAQDKYNLLLKEDAERQVRDCYSNYDMGLITSKELFGQLADIYTYTYKEMIEITYEG